MTDNHIWYAVMTDLEDTDHGTGSRDIHVAYKLARKYIRNGELETYIAVISEADDYCLDVINNIEGGYNALELDVLDRRFRDACGLDDEKEEEAEEEADEDAPPADKEPAEPVTRAWKIYGREGHRQSMSFEPSMAYIWHHERSEWYKDRLHIILTLLNADVTGTNDYTICIITAPTAAECEAELSGQLDDGFFENCRYGVVEECDCAEVSKLYRLDGQPRMEYYGTVSINVVRADI